ncbi:MAG: penicillin-binding protein [Lactobacillus sp.]|nr:penicillin-binding protein [Lactobacillus sp.]
MKNFNNLNKNRSKAHSYRFTVGRVLQIVLALVFLVFIGRFLYIGISKDVAGQNIGKRTNELYKRNEVLKATRGTIYDHNGSVIAEDSHTYTVYAILDKSSVDYKNRPMYVTNKEKTATKLAEVLPLSEKKILSYLNPKHSAYQVEFGAGGAGLSLEQKNKIEAMKLPGIKFEETSSRLYPNGEFASHVIGLAQLQSNKKGSASQSLVGTMGIEQYFNKQLAGKNGYRESFVDAADYQSPTNNHVYKQKEDGDNIYLTLDSQLQTYMENLLDKVQSKYDPKSMTAVVEDVKTGKILAASQRPTFDPQTKKGLDSNWRNILIQDSFEPGSVFKILSMTTAIQTGHYNPNQYYKSGSITLNGSTIHDWNTTGWGSIPMSQAFPRSSNVGMATLEQEFGNTTWKEYLKKFHIGEPTGVTLPGENPGLVNIKNKLDGAVTSFGQGVNVNVMQMMQVYSALANNGQMIKPQLVDKIVSPNGKTVESFHREKVGSPVFSKETTKQTLKLMQDVVNKEYGTGRAYKISGKSLAVKTGTAQVAGPHGGYLTGDNNYIFSVVGLTPANHPRYCVYITMRQPQKMTDDPELILAQIFKPLVNRLSVSSGQANVTRVAVPDVTNKSLRSAKNSLGEKGLSTEVIGDGKSVIRQGTDAGVKVNNGSKVLLYTGGTIKCPDMKGWSKDEVMSFSSITGIPITISGEGNKVVSQNTPKDQVIDQNSKLSVTL